MYKIIEAYKTADGRLFEREREAESHGKDLLGQALDDFLPHDDRGNITQTDRYNVLMKQLSDPKTAERLRELSRLADWQDKGI